MTVIAIAFALCAYWQRRDRLSLPPLHRRARVARDRAHRPVLDRSARAAVGCGACRGNGDACILRLDRAFVVRAATGTPRPECRTAPRTGRPSPSAPRGCRTSTSCAPSRTTIRSAMRTVEKRCDTRIVMRPPSPRVARRLGVALEQRVLGLGVERGGRLVEHEQQRVVAHEPARQRELLPLAERQLDAARPGRAELRVEPGRQPLDHVVGAGAIDGRRDRRRRRPSAARRRGRRCAARGTRSGRSPGTRRPAARATRRPASRASGVSSTKIAPGVGSYIFASSFTSVVLPAPFSPTMATTAPAGSVSDTSSSTTRDGARVGERHVIEADAVGAAASGTGRSAVAASDAA